MINTEYLLKSLMISSNSEYAVSEGLNFIINRLRLRDSTYKRQKKIENTKYYVKPEEKPIGSKWRMVPNSSKSIPDYELIQRRFQFVAISETLRSLFDNDVFKQMYFEYNNKKPHTCENGSYYDFCCGAIYKKHDIFADQLTIQIQLGLDDFDPGDAVMSKAGNQKNVWGLF